MESIVFATAEDGYCADYWKVPCHKHDYYELVYYRKGRGISCVGETKFEFDENCFVIIPPGIVHSQEHFVDCYLTCVGFWTDECFDLFFGRDVQGMIMRVVKSIVQESYDQHIEYEKMLSIRLNELIIMLNRVKQGRSSRTKGKNFEYVVKYIEENYHEKIQLRDFASKFHFSYDYFQHQFKEEVGISPKKLLIQKRVEAAEMLLNDEDLSCTEIAYRCGFSDSAQFSVIFKREKGMPPQQYRKEQAL